MVLKNPNFALAPDGNRFALLDGSVLRIFDLPSVSADERAKYLALAGIRPKSTAVLRRRWATPIPKTRPKQENPTFELRFAQHRRRRLLPPKRR